MPIDATPRTALYTQERSGTKVVLEREQSWGDQVLAKAIVSEGHIEQSICYGPHSDWGPEEYRDLARWAETVAGEMEAQRAEGDGE